MPHLSHDTLKSSPDENGNCHRICIDPCNDKCSTHIRTYETKIYTYSDNKCSDPRHEQICIAKFPATGHGRKEWALLEVSKSRMVRQTAAIFAKIVLKNGRQLVFTCPQYASLDCVAIFSRKRCKGEYVVFEDKMMKFEHFVDSSGRIIELSSAPTSRRGSKNTRPKVNSSNLEASCDLMTSGDQHCSLPEMTTSTQPGFVTPSAPPCEEESPPSYDQIFGISSYQTMINNSNNNNNNYNNSNYYMNNSPQNISYTPYGQCSSCSPPLYTERDPLALGHCQCTQPAKTNSCYSDEETNGPHALLTAFIHFDFWHSEGQRVVSNLKGTCEQGHVYTLTTPTIHSLTREFGARDQGEAGMMRVIANHVCSSLCRHLPNMQHIFEQAQINAAMSMS